MPTAVHTPRINNNDDTVRLAAILAEIGAPVKAGDPIVDVETDKATFTVESTIDGYLLRVEGQPGDTLQVGSILAWIGASAGEPIDNGTAIAPEPAADGASSDSATLKALLLLTAHGLKPSDVPHTGRLTAADVERYVASGPRQKLESISRQIWADPTVPGRFENLSPERRGMVRTVSWHRDQAAAGYVELSYDPGPWESYAAAFQKSHSLLMSPLLPLMVWRLARIAAEHPQINATVSDTRIYLYSLVNIAFTVQAGSNLYLVVLRDAASRSAEHFVRELGELQRAAMKNDLRPEQTSDATIGFTSMARWNVSRHIPILVPQTSLMVAHSSPENGAAHLGATYDHRVLTGFDVVHALRLLAAPPESK